MNLWTLQRASLRTPLGIGAAASFALAAGCQTYTAVPLDLAEYQSRVGSRTADGESVARFADRLTEAEGNAPLRFDFADGLSASEAEVLALFYNPELRLARLGAASALASLETAGLWEDPVFGFDAAEILSPEGPLEFGLMLEATIPLSGRLAIERDRAGTQYEAALRRVVEAEWSMRMAVRAKWAEWSAAKMRERLLKEFVDDGERVVRLTDALEEAGELARVEVRLVRAELGTARMQLVDAKLDATIYRLELLELMGLNADAPVALEESMALASVQMPADMESAIILSNPTLAVRRAEYLVAEESLRLEIQKQYPDLTIGAGYGNEDDDRLLLGFGVQIPMLNANRAGIAEAKAQRDIARAQAEAAFERLRRQLKLSVEILESVRVQRAAFERELVPLVDEQLEEVEQLIDLGQVDTLLLLETFRRRFEVKSRLLELRLSETRAEVAIDQLIGPAELAQPAPVNEPVRSETGTALHDAADAQISAEEIAQ